MQISDLANQLWEVVLKVWDCKHVKFTIYGTVSLAVGWMILLMFARLLVAWESHSHAPNRRMPRLRHGSLADQDPPVSE